MAAQQTESSVLVSIADILREGRLREESDRAEAEQRARDDQRRRADEAQRLEAALEARRVAEAEAEERRAFEERRRAAEIDALREATLARARLDAEAKARLAELAARQEHERRLKALGEDRHKRKLTRVLATLAVVVVAGAVGGGVAIRRQMDEAAALRARAAELGAEIEASNGKRAELEAKIARATDPARIAALEAELDAERAHGVELRNLPPSRRVVPVVSQPKPAPTAAAPTEPTCAKGDPMCPGL